MVVDEREEIEADGVEVEHFFFELGVTVGRVGRGRWGYGREFWGFGGFGWDGD